jgi:hypothetical protein
MERAEEEEKEMFSRRKGQRKEKVDKGVKK